MEFIHSGRSLGLRAGAIHAAGVTNRAGLPIAGVNRNRSTMDTLGNPIRGGTVNTMQGRAPRAMLPAGPQAAALIGPAGNPGGFGLRGPSRPVKPSILSRYGRYVNGNLRTAVKGIGIDFAFAGADILAQGMVHSSRWAAKTGLEQDYIGGFVYGATKAGGANIAATAGFIGGSVAGGIIGGIIGGIGGYMIGETAITDYAYQAGRFFSSVAATGIARRKVQFGTGFQDSQEAFTMRQVAVQEMAGSLLNARQYLGNEGFFMHK